MYSILKHSLIAPVDYKEFALTNQLGEQGLDILLFPCNQFLGQEPGTSEEVKAEVEHKFGMKECPHVQMMEKVRVKAGDGQHTVYRFLYEKAGLTSNVDWNFAKV